MTRPAFAPVKPVAVETPRAAVRRLVDENGGAKRAAVKLGRAASTIYAYCDAEASDQITFAQVASLTSHDAPAAAEYLAALADGVFLPIACDDANAQALTATAARESGEAMASLIAALADGRIGADEARKALPEVDDALRALCGLRSMLLAATGVRADETEGSA